MRVCFSAHSSISFIRRRASSRSSGGVLYRFRLISWSKRTRRHREPSEAIKPRRETDPLDGVAALAMTETKWKSSYESF
jgi:hypothetical protein